MYRDIQLGKRLAAFVARPAICLFFLFLPLYLHSQIPITLYEIPYPNDLWTTTEALRIEHESAASLLAARAAIELVNNGLSEAASAAGVHYDSIKVDLDRYDRMFDLIDVLYNGLHLAFRSYNSISNIVKYAEDYAEVIGSYVDELKEHKHFLLADQCLFEYATEAVEGFVSDCEGMHRTFLGLSMYTVSLPVIGDSPAKCTTSTLTFIMGEIERFLSGIERRIYDLYSLTYRYMLMRRGYWPVGVIHQTKQAIASKAFNRWKENTDAVHNGSLQSEP